MLFLEMIFKTIVLVVLIIILAVLEVWVMISGAILFIGGEMPGLIFLPPLDHWPKATIAVFIIALLVVSRIVVRVWNDLGAWEYFFVYRLGKY